MRNEFTKIITLKIITPASDAKGCQGIGEFSSAEIIAGGNKIIHDMSAINRFDFKVLAIFDAVSLNDKKLSSVGISKSILFSGAGVSEPPSNKNETSALLSAGKSFVSLPITATIFPLARKI